MQIEFGYLLIWINGDIQVEYQASDGNAGSSSGDDKSLIEGRFIVEKVSEIVVFIIDFSCLVIFRL